MFKQLANLTVEADGRYATAEELKFLKDYLDSVETRISAYEKVREQSGAILKRIEEVERGMKEDVLHVGDRDVTKRIIHDMTSILRCAAGAMLFNDFDRMREGMLVWFATIARSFGFQKQAAATYKVAADIMPEFMTAEEAALMSPIFRVAEAVIGN